ncbi:MAG: diguanylate cyclase [Candidatus Sumerlaeaceae bacterium]
MDSLSVLAIVGMFSWFVSVYEWRRSGAKPVLACVVAYAWIVASTSTPDTRDFNTLISQLLIISLPVLAVLVLPQRALNSHRLLTAIFASMLAIALHIALLSTLRKVLGTPPFELLIFSAPGVGLSILLVFAWRQKSILAISTSAALLIWFALWLLTRMLGVEFWMQNSLIVALLIGPLAILLLEPSPSRRVTDRAVTFLAQTDDANLRDALTGAFNRRALDTEGMRLFKQTLKSDRPISVLMLDIDHFKPVNDLYGHAVGDAVLAKFSQVISTQVRGTDMVSRYGGEEFVVLLPGAPLAPAMRLAEQMRDAVQQNEIAHGERTLKITTSVGVTSTFPGDNSDFAQTIARADRNLYRAKHNGRNRVMADPLPGEL